MPGTIAPANSSHAAPVEEIPVGPDALARIAQNKVLAQGQKLNPQETAKREINPLDQWDGKKRSRRRLIARFMIV